MQKVLILIGLISVSLLTGCFHELGLGDHDRPVVILGTGSIEFVNLEGGFYGIVADDDSKYLPLNLPAEFQNDGLRVSFELHVAKDTTTIQQWGIPVRIVRIETLN